MGCDYYIIRHLDIKYISNDNIKTKYIELSRYGKYFPDYDNDEEKLCEKYLNVNYKPKLLFNDKNNEWKNGWKNEQVRIKYEDIIKKEINEKILLIIEQEIRHLR